MKSSVRILAIALALAFLLLARSAFQDSAIALDDFDLDDGEAAFADLNQEGKVAEYVGLEEAGMSMVYFYVSSDDLGTQVTASTTMVSTITNSDTFTLPSGTAVPGTYPGDDNEDANLDDVKEDLDGIYCTANATTTDISFTDELPSGSGDRVALNLPSGWGLDQNDLPTGVTVGGNDGEIQGCDRGKDAEEDLIAAATTTVEMRDSMANAEKSRIEDADLERATRANEDVYRYGSKSSPATSTNMYKRYTRGVAGIDIGGDMRPLASVKVTQAADPDNDDTQSEDLPTSIANADAGLVRVLGGAVSGRSFDVNVTYDIVDRYQITGSSDATPPDYTSGYARAVVNTNGTDRDGEVIALVEVDDGDGIVGDGNEMKAPKTNLFRGMVIITNDASKNRTEGDSTVYVRDAETLTVTIYDGNNRRGDVLATASVVVDTEKPEVSDLEPATKSVIRSTRAPITFTITDDGAALHRDDAVSAMSLMTADGEDTCNLLEGERGSLPTLPVDRQVRDAYNEVRATFSWDSGESFDESCGNVVDTTTLGNNSHGIAFVVAITADDLAGNSKFSTSSLTIDASDPEVQLGADDMTDGKGVKETDVGVLAGKAWDGTKNQPTNSKNSILIKFNESLDEDTVAAGDFTVAGYTVTAAEVVGENANPDGDDDDKYIANEYVVLTLGEDLTQNAGPSVTVSGVSDIAGNTIDATQGRSTHAASNKVAPALTVVPFGALLAKDDTQAIGLTADEALLRGRAAVSGPSGAATDGSSPSSLSVKVTADTTGATASFSQKTFDDDGAYGVMLEVTDVDENTSKSGSVSAKREDVSDDIPNDGFGELASVIVTPANWPPADSDLDGSVLDEFKLYVGGADDATRSEATAIDWSTGKVTFAAVDTGIKSNSQLAITYNYVDSDQVIQVDTKAPTMTSRPEDETDYAATAVQFIWSDDDGYAGDSYKTVTLNEASHEGPNGTSTDILDMLSTNDSETWVLRPAADLALGDHEFTLKATDAAGNSNEVSVTITVIERKPVKIDLGPGWNLISLRGMPASADVNDVFSSDTVSVVSQYDGRRVSPWTVWTRGSDGSLSSSPAGRTTIDSALGLWVLSSDGSALEVDIPGTSRDNPAEVPSSIDLIVGWNLVAVILISDDVVGVNEYLPEGVWTRAFLLDNDTGQFKVFSPLARPTTGDNAGQLLAGEPLKAGQALWVYATKAGVIVPK